ncbi:HHE/GGDEF domain protein [Vibrio ichthyoenteri ATCC 700023]|uniref:diguanylate cyclase n=1 Tax=Vibrio ichthyoenteri ATCC 700023 TaxID=870968 RepID=F9S483_9VIBR|nr:GGDEF domain-containing protein [Vibrio ichthyoenteri]EGU37299.1 HHE/GGDEF domain protein [Vibrio ichthyoenteri ATCC 700023]
MPNSEIVVFPWNPNFETGIDHIDAQHKTLFQLVNKLANSLVHENRIEVAEVFDELANYATYHFAEEEQIWAEHFQCDHWMLSHTHAHNSFLPDIEKIKRDAITNCWQDTIENVLQFLIRWLALHILDDDKKMSLVVNELKNDVSLSEAKKAAKRQMRGSVGVLIDTVLTMYDELSSHAIELIREKHRRIIAEKNLTALNAQLQQQAMTDQLSGLFNRRHFMAIIEAKIQKANRGKSPLCFISLDLDLFKSINDTLGHLKGDEAIERVGSVLAQITADNNGCAFRMGGEEFLLVVANRAHHDGLTLAELIRLKIANIVLTNQEKKLSHHLTCSIGVFCHTPQHDEDFLFFLNKVDDALYQAKSAGRNSVISANQKAS